MSRDETTSDSLLKIQNFQALAELVRIYHGGSGNSDLVARSWLENHAPPLVELIDMGTALVTDEGARVVGELLATFEEQT